MLIVAMLSQDRKERLSQSNPPPPQVTADVKLTNSLWSFLAYRDPQLLETIQSCLPE